MKNKAFTLVELLVAILIIGILATIALTQYKRADLKSKYIDMKNSLYTIANAEERYLLLNGKYTDNRDNLDINFPFSETVNEKHKIQVSNNITCGIEGAADGWHMMYCSISKYRITLLYWPLKHRYICCNYKLDNLYNDEFCKKEMNNTAQSQSFSNSSRRCYEEKH